MAAITGAVGYMPCSVPGYRSGVSGKNFSSQRKCSFVGQKVAENSFRRHLQISRDDRARHSRQSRSAGPVRVVAEKVVGIDLGEYSYSFISPRKMFSFRLRFMRGLGLYVQLTGCRGLCGSQCDVIVVG